MMISTELLAIKKVFRKNNDVQELFEEIIQKILEFKYKRLKKSGLAVPVSGKDITKFIFGLSTKDEIEIYGQGLNGQRIIELFIATIYLKVLVSQLEENSYIIIGIPFQEGSFDIAFYVIESEARNISNKLYIPKDSKEYKIQIKENFDFKQENLDKL